MPETKPRPQAPTTKKPEKKGFKLDPQYNYAVTVGGVGLLGSLILILFLVRPLALGLYRSTQELNNKRIESGELKKKVTDLTKMKENYIKLGETNRQRILTALPPDPDSPHLLAVLEVLGGRAGVAIKTVTPQEPLPAGAAGHDQATTTTGPAPTNIGSALSMPVIVSVAGSYESIQKFLHELENGPRMMDISSISFSGTGNPLEAQVMVRAYYQPDAGAGS